jgi:hypothetical protein
MTASLIHQMYISYYQRPADPAGLVYWQAQLTANGGGEAGWNVVAAAFANAAESTVLYGSQTLSQKISAIYLSAFERAATTDEVTFWANAGFTEAQVAFAIVNGAQNDDLSTVNNKETYAVNFVAALDPAGTGIGPFEFEYTDASIGRTLMDAVTSSSDVSVATVAAQVSENVPTLVTVSLTSGADTVTPTSNAVEDISAALGGSSPSLGRTDAIDGGSASDTMTITTDGNFLLGFSTGYIKNVETLNFDTTATSVTTKLINLTGVSGVETFNIGASKANVKLSEITDVGKTINVSGLATGTFEVGFASGAISASGSAMTLGVSDIGTTGAAVSMITQGVTDLTIVANGVNNTESFVNLGNTNNTYQTISVIGNKDLYISDVGSAASAILASSFAGDLTIGLDLDTNEKMGASGEIITGGAGTDTLRLLGSAQIKAGTSSIEELLFDGSEAEVTIKASGMVGIQTLTFSGQNSTNAINISGLDFASSRTINSILEAASPVTQTYSAGGDLTVNLNVDPTWVAATTKRDNDFTLTAKNSGAVTLNVGQYTSAAGTHVFTNASGLVVNVDTTGHFGGTVRSDKAGTISVEGGANIDAVVSGLAATTFSFNVASGTIAYGSTALTTVSLTNSGSVQITAATRTSSVETITVDTQSMADFALVGTTSLTTLQLSGAGTIAAAKIGTHSGVSNNLTMSITGMAGGFSAGDINKISSDLTVAGAASDGFLFFDSIIASGVTVTTGSIQNFNADAINAEKFTFDGAASTSTSNSASINLGAVTASSTITISLGQGTGHISAAGLNTLGSVTIDGSNFDGSVNIPNISGSGVTISMGTNGFFSASTIQSNKAFTLDGSDAASSQVSLGLVEASTNLTISLGSGSGSLTVAGSAPGLSAGGALVIDASKGAAKLHVFSMTASGATVSLGTPGYFSATDVRIGEGGFTLDGAVATSSTIVAQSISSSAALTISLGSGSGRVTITALDTQGAFTLDGSNSKATIDISSISASGISVVTGMQGDFSANAIVSDSNLVVDASNAMTAGISLRNASVSGSITVSMGSGVGTLGASGLHAIKGITIDAAKFGGTMDLGGISGSGVTISLGTAGNLSASSILTTTTFTLDGGAAASANVTISQLDVSANAAITLGSGAGTFSMGSASANGSFTLDGSNSNAAISIARLSASGTISIVTGVSGSFSAGLTKTTGTGGFVLDASNATATVLNLSNVSVGNVDSTISLGSGTGTFSAAVLAGDGSFTIDASKSNAAIDVASISASGISVTLGAAGNYSSNIISSGKLFTLDGSNMASADIDLKGVSASGGISMTLAGSATISSFEVNSLGSFSLNAAGAAESIDITNMSASGVSITTGLQGDLSASAIYSSKFVTVDASGATTASITINAISASAAISLTLGSGSGFIAMVTARSIEKSFTLDASRFDGEVDVQNLLASGGTISLGTGGDFSASVIAMQAGTFTLNATSSDASGESINITSISASGMTMNMASKGAVSANIASAHIASDLNFSGLNYNGGLDITDLSASGVTITTGAAFNYSAQSSSILGNFTLNGGALTSANLTFNTLSASGSVAMSFGQMSGDLVVSAMSVGKNITWSAESAAGLGVRIGAISAGSAFTITLGEVSDTSNNFSASIITANTFTLNASLYRESINLHNVSASAVTITAGDLTDDLTLSSLTTTNFTFNGGDGSNFSANITSANISGSAWSITMGELGNGLAIGDVTFGSSWTIKGTQGIDSISASAANTVATNIRVVDIDFRDDAVVDTAGIAGSAGKTYVIMRNFDAGEDNIGLAVSAAASIAITAAAAYMNDVLGTTLTASDIASAGTALFTYNSDSYYIGAEDAGTALGNGDYVVRFVGVTDIVNNTDIFNITAD